MSNATTNQTVLSDATRMMPAQSLSGECWILQNSWGPGKGFNGYFFVDTAVDNNCGIFAVPNFLPAQLQL